MKTKELRKEVKKFFYENEQALVGRSISQQDYDKSFDVIDRLDKSGLVYNLCCEEAQLEKIENEIKELRKKIKTILNKRKGA